MRKYKRKTKSRKHYKTKRRRRKVTRTRKRRGGGILDRIQNTHISTCSGCGTEFTVKRFGMNQYDEYKTKLEDHCQSHSDNNECKGFVDDELIKQQENVAAQRRPRGEVQQAILEAQAVAAFP